MKLINVFTCFATLIFTSASYAQADSWLTDFFAMTRTYEYVAPKVSQTIESACWTQAHNCENACANGIFAVGEAVSNFCKTTTTAEMSFVGTGNDGTKLQTETLASNSLFKTMLSSGRPELRVRTSWQLASCDNVTMSAPTDTTDIEATIRQLRTYDFNQYMSCQFTAVSTAASESAVALTIYPTYMMNLTVLDNDDVQFTNTSHTSIYFTRKVAAQPGAETAATQAATQFADIVKGYGTLLVDLRDAPTPDRKASLLGYLAQNKQKLLTALQTIDQNLPSCGTMAKLNVTFTIKKGYAYVHTLEAKILGEYPFGDIVGN